MLAPAPKVEDEPSATILIGLPAARRRAIRGSGWSKRTCSMVTAQAAGAALSGDAGAAIAATGRGGCASAGDVAINAAAVAAASNVLQRKKTLCLSSCPALCRASTSFVAVKQDVDGRAKPGHDEGLVRYKRSMGLSIVL